MTLVGTGPLGVRTVDRDLSAGILQLGVAAQVIHVAVRVEHVVDVAEAEPDLGHGRRQILGRRAEHRRVDQGRLRAAHQVHVRQAATLERRGKSVDPLVDTLKAGRRHQRSSRARPSRPGPLIQHQRTCTRPRRTRRDERYETG